MSSCAAAAIVAIATIAWNACPAAAQTATSPQTATSVTVYQAFGAHGSIELHTRTRAGDCPSGSEMTPRRDAWRCFSGNLIYDPCFSSAYDLGSVVCPGAPWLNTAVKIRLSKPLAHKFANHAIPSPDLQPWALELYDGRRCVFASGASNLVEGQRLNYFCGANSQEGLWGLPSRASQPWTILTASSQAASLSARASILHAWM
jgi:hypothetical protein